MFGILATQNSTFIIGDVARFLGWIMEGIYNLLSSAFHVENVGLTIILFTIVVYSLMFPLTYKQQKFSKLSSKMNPELNMIRKKYAGKTDQASMMAMQEEQKELYEKYGVSASGSCIQLLIQMPILFGLYRVIYNIPAYIGSVKGIFTGLVNSIMSTPGYQDKLANVASKNYSNANKIIDALNNYKPAQWTKLAEEFPELSGVITETQGKLSEVNNFLGLNIGHSPSDLIKTGTMIVMIAAIMIPVLAALTQWLNVKLMPQAAASSTGDDDNAMAQSMKQMNMIMPIMSAVFCFTLPCGLGIYWIMSALVRTVQQLILNRHFDKIDLDELVKQNLEKINEKRAKQGLPPKKINVNAQRKAMEAEKRRVANSEEDKKKREAEVKKSTEYYSQNGKKGSIASKASMVKQYNEKNTKK